MNVQELMQLEVGNFLVLQDFHTLEACGDDYHAQITETKHWKHEGFQYFGFVMEPDKETTLMLLIRVLRGSGGQPHEFDCKLMRLYDQGIPEGMDMGKVIFAYDESTDSLEFTPGFEIQFNEDEEPDIFGTKDSYPIHHIRNESNDRVSICEWYNGSDIPDQYWAQHCFVSWDAFVGDNGMKGYTRMWFGWDVSESEFTFIY